MNDDDITFELGADIIVNTDANIIVNTDINTDNWLSVGDITTSISGISNCGTISIDTGSDAGSIYTVLDNYIDPDQVEHMCETYPALSKVWRNFKSVYDMTLQDYKGKKEQGEIDEPNPF